VLKTIWRYKWRILSCALIAAAIYHYWMYISEPDWHASAMVF
jgi:LPS O-antigen subunit length determinant protein (WzzB/FepE family)